jgi:hypothetical protein
LIGSWSPSWGAAVQRPYEARDLERGADGDLADFGVFDDAAAKLFDSGLKHGAAEVVAVDVKPGERLEEAAERNEESVDFGKAGRRLAVNEGGAPAIGINELDEVVLGLGLDASPKEAAGGASSLPADVVESRAGALGFEHIGGSERVGVGDLAIFLFRNLGGRDAEAEQAGIDRPEGFLYRGVIQKIMVDEGAKLGIGVHERATADGADFVDDGGSAAGFEDGIADGTGGTEEEDFHGRGIVHDLGNAICNGRECKT